jgi:hypothetical protein
MKNILRKTLVATAAVLSFGAAQSNELTFQGVTFQTIALDADTLQLNILNADAATGDWTGIGFLKAFEIKDIGNVTGATLAGWSVSVDDGLAANGGVGCNTGGTPGACFSRTPALALTDSMTFVIDFTGTNLDFSEPSLKVQFLVNADDTFKKGSLLSQPIPIPEPETYALMLAGLGIIGFLARRRRQA